MFARPGVYSNSSNILRFSDDPCQKNYEHVSNCFEVLFYFDVNNTRKANFSESMIRSTISLSCFPTQEFRHSPKEKPQGKTFIS